VLGEVTFALLGTLFLLTGLRTFLSSLYQVLFGNLPNTTIGAIAFAVFAAAALAPLLARMYGQRRAVGLSALALALATAASAFIRIAPVDLVVSAVAVVSGSWWLALLHASRPEGRPSPLPVALPLALATDFALRHAFRTVPVVDLPLSASLPLVLAAVLVFVAAGLATIADARTWTSPGTRGALALTALPPLLMVGETGLTNAAQVALAAGLGLGPEPARATQIGAAIVGLGLAAGAILLTRDLPRRPIGAALLVAGAALMWLHLPVVSLVGGALGACGLLIGASALVTPSVAGKGGLAAALPLAVGWVLFVAIGFAYHAYYLTPALWVATAAVALVLLATPAVQGPRLGLGPALLVAAIAVVIPLVALFPFRAPESAPEQATFRLMTYNVHQGFDVGQVPSLDALADTILREAPDVLVLQEVVRGWVIDEQHDVLSVLAERLGMAYVWQGNIGDLYGNAILSRMPMTDVRRVSYAKEPAIRHQQRGALVARISGVLVIVTHLDEHADSSDVRQRQVRELLRAWGDAPVAVIAGDLNAVPASLEMDLLARSGFSDLALQAGADEGTFPSDKPDRRIDYVWGVGLTGAQAHTVASTASDHRAVVVNITRVSGR